MAGIDAQLDALRAAPGDLARLTTVRRSFHTLKGSSRMVGLMQFGEGAWAVEQSFNAWLSQERAATEDLIALAAAARALMGDWSRRIRLDPAAAIDPQPLVDAAHRVREGQPFELDAALLPKVEEEAPLPLIDLDILETNLRENGGLPGPAIRPQDQHAQRHDSAA